MLPPPSPSANTGSTQGDYAKARLRFQQVVALTPESYTGHFQLAVADEHLGLLPEARQHLEIACKIAPHDENCARELKSLAKYGMQKA